MSEVYDVVIIGSGAAGMNVAIYNARAGLKVAIIERGLYGGVIQDTAFVNNYLGFESISGAELSEKMHNHMLDYDIDEIYGDVKSVDRDIDSNIFSINLRKKVIKSKTVVVATGVKHRKLGIEGEGDYMGMGISNCANCDGHFFKGKDIVVIGAGYSAFEEGSYLSNIANKVTLIYH